MGFGGSDPPSLLPGCFEQGGRQRVGGRFGRYEHHCLVASEDVRQDPFPNVKGCVAREGETLVGSAGQLSDTALLVDSEGDGRYNKDRGTGSVQERRSKGNCGFARTSREVDYDRGAWLGGHDFADGVTMGLRRVGGVVRLG